MTTPFVHLRLHTEYSMQDSVIRIEDLLEAAHELKMPAIGLSDQNNLFATIKFYKEALQKGIKPIVGVDLLILDDNNAKQTFLMSLFCLSEAGFRSLSKIVSRAYVEGQHLGIPCIRASWLTPENCEGLIALQNYQSRLNFLLEKQSPELENYFHYLQERFPQRWYIEISRTDKKNEFEFEKRALKFAAEKQIPLVATNDVRFLISDDFDAHEARVAIAAGEVLTNEHRPKRYTKKQYLASMEEMQILFSDLPSAIQNTVEIAKRCSLTMKLGESFLPQYPTGDLDIHTYLIQHAEAGLKERFANLRSNIDHQIYIDRLATELRVITQMGFSGYFLIVADFIAWSKANNIPVGPGRGSGAGSLVAYALGITDIDPLPYDLLFERFLNPERVSMPDFDIDFCMDGRDRVIDYVADKYGRESVSQIITYGSMAAKAVVRDVGRVLGHPYPFVDKIAKLIPFELGITLDKAMEMEPQLKQRYDDEEDVKNLLDLALKLEGLVRNAGKHAGGVVIAPSKLTDFTPLYCEANGENLVSQFDKDDVEAVGLVKFDFLGLRTLTIIQHAIENIERSRGLRLSISEILLDDQPTYELLKRGETTAVFQLESRGMKDLIKRLKPDCFEDIIALVALFRPGPLQSGMVDDFIQRKHGIEPITYLHPALEPVLKPTYGIILYQEQVMQIAQVLAGYTLGAADLLRRAMGKKKAEEMAQQRSIFQTGANANGIDTALADAIFDLMEKFAGYGFNKSHSAAYALLSYQTAWLKMHYPAEFMAAVLSSDMDNTDKVVNFINECQAMQLPVIPPNINEGDYPFTVRDQKEIIYGLGAVKGAGDAALSLVLKERNENGPYRHLFDLCERNDLRKLNKRVVEVLIKSGALDCFEQNRATLFASIDTAFQYAEQKTTSKVKKQGDLLSLHLDHSDTLPPYVMKPAWSLTEKLQAEKDSLGWYLSGHPLSAYADEIKQFSATKVAHLTPKSDKTTRIIAQITGIRSIMTKRGDRMMIVSFEDETGRIDGSLFSEECEKYRSVLQDGAIVCAEGTVEPDNFTQGLRMSVKRMSTLGQLREVFGKALLITVDISKAALLLKPEFQRVLKAHPGNFPVWIRYQNKEAHIDSQLGTQWRVNPSDELLQNLQKFLGKDAVKIAYLAN